MVHIVFNEAEVDLMQKVMELDASLSGEVIQIKDDYAVGPLQDIYTTEGIAARKEWWRSVLAGGDYAGLIDKNTVDDDKTVTDLKEKLLADENEIVWIWAAQNKHDVCGYYWLISQLKDFQGRVFLLYLNNLPFINEKGQLFYPEWLHQIQPKEFLKAKKLARPVTLSEFEVDPDEWKKICNESRGVRLLEGGKKLAHEDYSFYDSELKRFIMPDWQKASKIIHNYLHKSKHTTGDAFLLWRLKEIIASGNYDVQGVIGNMKEFEIKYKAKQEESVEGAIG